MTQTNTITTKESQTNQVKFSYQVAMPQPTSHLFEVKLQVNNWKNNYLDLKMPVWTPGSYLVREYSKQVQELTAQNSQTQDNLSSQKLSKNHWQVDTGATTDITISYKVYANELSVRTNHLDHTHGYFNPAALCLYIPGYQQQGWEIKIIPPESDWQVTTPLPEIAKSPNTYWASDFDTLVDSPFEIGTHQLHEFTVQGKQHQLAIWGTGNLKVDRVIADIAKIIEVEAKIYQGLPYTNYLFLLHLSGKGFGGLEHKNACSLNYPRLGFRNPEKYNRFMQLVAHEFFHLWNIKRIRPKALETFDYEQENYTTSLWFAEGTTSYYDLLIPLWAGIYDTQTFLQNLGQEISKYLNIPGRQIQPVSEASFDAWIKLYRRDANSDNSQISYYLKGELLSLLLDLLIRSRHENKRSLNDVMLSLWKNYGKSETGYTPEQLKATIEGVAEIDLSDFFDQYVYGVAEIPIASYLELFGLKLQPVLGSETIPYLGIKLKDNHTKAIAAFVTQSSPAAMAGINPGDELLAVNNWRVQREDWEERLKDYQPGDKIEVTLFHHDELRTVTVKLAPPQPTAYNVVFSEELSETQKQNCQGWLNQLNLA